MRRPLRATRSCRRASACRRARRSPCARKRARRERVERELGVERAQVGLGRGHLARESTGSRAAARQLGRANVLAGSAPAAGREHTRAATTHTKMRARRPGSGARTGRHPSRVPSAACAVRETASFLRYFRFARSAAVVRAGLLGCRTCDDRAPLPVRRSQVPGGNKAPGASEATGGATDPRFRRGSRRDRLRRPRSRARSAPSRHRRRASWLRSRASIRTSSHAVEAYNLANDRSDRGQGRPRREPSRARVSRARTCSAPGRCSRTTPSRSTRRRAVTRRSRCCSARRAWTTS